MAFTGKTPGGFRSGKVQGDPFEGKASGGGSQNAQVRSGAPQAPMKRVGPSGAGSQTAPFRSGVPQGPMKIGSAAEDAKDGGRDDASESAVPRKLGTKKKGGLPPGLQAAIARKIGVK